MKKAKINIRKFLVSFLALFIIISSSLTYFYYSAKNAQAAWYDDGWYYRIKLTIDHTKVTADQTDFPVYVDLSSLPSVFHSQVNRIDGRDIRVTKGDGITELAREVSFYDYANRKGELHFKYSGTLSGSVDTSIYIYYGNSLASDYAATDTYGRNNVWGSSAAAVWHFSETSGHHINSSSTSGIDTAAENVTQKGAYIGKVGRANEYSGNADDVNILSNSAFYQPGNFTISTWIKIDTLSSTLARDQVIACRHLSLAPYEEYCLYLNHNNDRVHFTNASVEYTGGSASFNTALSINTWYHVVGVKSGTNMTIYVNGSNGASSDGTYVGTYPNQTGDFFIGDYDSNNNTEFDGVVDEVRLMSTNRSNTWVAAEYNNQNSPSTFFSISTSEEQKNAAIAQLSFNEGFLTTAHDSSPNRYDGTLSGVTLPSWQNKEMCVSGKCLYYNGSTAYTSITSSIANMQTVSFWVKPKTTTETLVDFDGGTHYISASSGVISATGFSGTVAIYVNGKESSTLTANNWQHIEVTTSTAFTASNITIGKQSTSFLNGFIDEFKLYDYVRTVAQVKADFSGVGGKDTSVNFGSGVSAVLSQGLVAYWKMDDNTGLSTIDSSGNGNTGTLTNGPTWTAGKYGSALSFDGASTGDDIVSVADSTTMDHNQAITISAWVYPQSTGEAGYGRILNSDTAYIFIVSSALNRFEFTPNNGVTWVASDPDTLSLNVWQHIIVVYDNNNHTFAFYKNGDLIGSGVTTDALVQTELLYLGNEPRTFRTFDGMLDEIRLYNRSLSPAEAQQLYRFAPGPVGHWKMDEKTGTAVNDVSGNGNNGILTSAVWDMGKVGSALTFNGGADVVSVSNSITTNTIGFWINPSSTTQNIIDLRTAATAASISVSSGTIAATGFTSPTIYVNGVESSTLSANTWQYVTITTATAITSNAIRLGRINSTSLTGKLDDVKIYDYVRTPIQINEDMNEGSMGDSLVHWDFDEGYGTTAHNRGSGGSQKNGTISNGTWSNSGVFGKAVAFSASTSVTTTLSDPGYSHSISLWVNPTTSIASKTLVTATKLITDASGRPTYGSCVGTALSLSTWTHITAISDGASACKIYQNGLQTAVGTTGVTFGTSLNLGNSSFIGSIDDFQFFSFPIQNSFVRTLANLNFAQQLGAVSTQSNGISSSNSNDRSYCVPGDTNTCNPPVGEWKMEEKAGNTTINSSAATSTLTLNNDASWDSGKFGNGIRINGVNSYLTSSADNDSLDLRTGSFSLFIWEKSTKTASDDIIIFKGSANATDTGYDIVIDSGTGKIQMYISNGSSYIVNQLTGATDVADGKWHQIGFTWNPAVGAKIYVDGKLDNSQAVTTAVDLNSSSPLLVGGYSSTGYSINGVIDGLITYNYERSPAQINWDFNRSAPVGHYKYNECVGTTLYNSALNANGQMRGLNGTLTLSGNAAGTCDSTTSTDSWYLGSTGKYNAALGLDGNDTVSLTDTAQYSFASSTQDFAIFAWVKRAATGANHFVISKEDGANDGWNMQITSSDLVSCAVNNIVFTSTSTIDTSWHHIGCVVTRAGTGQVYIDGKADGTAVAISSTAMTITSATTSIGVRNYTPAGTYFNGLIDDLRLYQYAPTAAQIKTITNEGTAVRIGPLSGAP